VFWKVNRKSDLSAKNFKDRAGDEHIPYGCTDVFRIFAICNIEIYEHLQY
jgi:hypothetical protein